MSEWILFANASEMTSASAADPVVSSRPKRTGIPSEACFFVEIGAATAFDCSTSSSTHMNDVTIVSVR
jgi:hypothetical protein